MKLVFDLDGTLCTDSQGNYLQAYPLEDRIKYVNILFESGNKIIILTARGMGTNEDNKSLAVEKWFDITRQQLSEWGLKYHELIFGKPSGDLYIDDKGIAANQFFQA